MNAWMYGYVNVGVNPSSSLGVWAPQDDATHTQVFSLPGHILLQFTCFISGLLAPGSGAGSWSRTGAWRPSRPDTQQAGCPATSTAHPGQTQASGVGPHHWGSCGYNIPVGWDVILSPSKLSLEPPRSLLATQPSKPGCGE